MYIVCIYIYMGMLFTYECIHRDIFVCVHMSPPLSSKANHSQVGDLLCRCAVRSYSEVNHLSLCKVDSDELAFCFPEHAG